MPQTGQVGRARRVEKRVRSNVRERRQPGQVGYERYSIKGVASDVGDATVDRVRKLRLKPGTASDA